MLPKAKRFAAAKAALEQKVRTGKRTVDIQCPPWMKLKGHVSKIQNVQVRRKKAASLRKLRKRDITGLIGRRLGCRL